MNTSQVPPEPEDANQDWIEARLHAMTLPEKIGQMIFLNLTTAAMTEKSAALEQIKHAVHNLHPGGLKVQGGDFRDFVPVANMLQQASATPLLFCGDFERGVGERFTGAVKFPPAMALGAIADPQFTSKVGCAIARESLAAGIPLIFAPVVDVNSRPDNPVINVRSFGDDPAQVAAHAAAFIRGMHEAGALATAKHFPGHGEVSEDSHLSIARCFATLEQLRAGALVPFAAAIDAGVDVIISAHLSLPNLGMPVDLPATMSRDIMTILLRDHLKFPGVVMTDSMEMWPMSKKYSPAEAAVQSVIAGADVVLDVLDAQEAVRGIRASVSAGAIPPARIDASVRRILALKTKVALHRQTQVSLSQIEAGAGAADTRELASEAARRCLTLVRDAKALLPLQLDSHSRIFLLDVFVAGAEFPTSTISRRFQAHSPSAQSMAVSCDTVAGHMERMLGAAKAAEVQVWNLFIAPACYSGRIGIPAVLAQALRRLSQLRKPTLAISFGDPYVLSSIPEVDAYLCAYDDSAMTQDAVLAALTGQAPITGRLPVTIPNHTNQ